jgi:tripartite-type tricarboxylate transporter receptor subunit TctC
MIRRAFLALLLASALPAAAQDAYPTKPIRLVVPFPPAGGTDVLSRSLAQAITASSKWIIVVDNKPGAGGNIGLDATAKAPPDGYTIAMGQTANLAVNPALYASMPFDPLKDFAPIALISSQPLILVVNANSPYKTLKDLVDAAKQSPGKINMASSSNGTIGHIGGELFQRRAGIKMTHVPYKGAGAAVTDLMGGNVDCFFGNSQAVGGQVTGGRLRALAVTSPQRLASFPTVIRGGHVERARRAGGNSAGDRRAPQCRGEQGARLERVEGEARRGRQHAARRHAAAVRRLHPQGAREVGRRGARGRHQARLGV